MKHSKLPWFEDSYGDVSNKKGQKILIDSDIRSHDVEFIVRACNSHYALLEACKYTIEQTGLSTNSPSYIKIQKAIAKAEGSNNESA